MTSTIEGAPDFRVTIEPSAANGLRAVSQIVVDKLAVVRRERIGARIGQLATAEIRRLNVALAFVIGLAD